MADLSGFDANQVEPSTGFGLIPKNDYDAVIVESEKKNTNAGDGAYISLTFQILSGEFQNRKLWLNLNLWNHNDEAVTIAKGQLSAICRAVGVMTPKDTSDLHDKPLKISVGQKKNKTTQNLENNITGFKPHQVQPVATTAVSSAPARVGAPW